MAAKPTINIRLTERQLAALKAEAERLGVSTADLIRRILDDWLDPEGL
jgi:predicted DNA binding CopG/RHH family protein